MIGDNFDKRQQELYEKFSKRTDSWARDEVATWKLMRPMDDEEQEEVLRLTKVFFNGVIPEPKVMKPWLDNNDGATVLLRRLIDQDYNKRYTEKTLKEKIR